MVHSGDELFVVVCPTGDPLQKLDGFVHLVDDIPQLGLVQILVRAHRNVDAEVGDLLVLGHDLIPLAVAAADVILEGEIGFGEFASEGPFVQVHRTPVIAHVGAEIPGPALRLGRLQAFQGEILQEGDGGGVGFAGQGIDVIPKTVRDGVEGPGSAGPAQAAAFMRCSVVAIVFVAQFFGFIPAFQGFFFVVRHSSNTYGSCEFRVASFELRTFIY